MKQLTESQLRKIIQEETEAILMDEGVMSAIGGGIKKAGELGMKGAKAAGGVAMKGAKAGVGGMAKLGKAVADKAKRGIVPDHPPEAADFQQQAQAGAQGAKGAKSMIGRAVKFMTQNKQLGPIMQQIAGNPMQSAIMVAQVMNMLGIDSKTFGQMLPRIKKQLAEIKDETTI